MAPNSQQPAALQRRGSLGRPPPGNAVALQPDGRSRQKQLADADVHYTVFIRLPFVRGEFVDPLPVLHSNELAKNRC